MVYALDDRGGGQDLPPYLQGRKPTPGGRFQTAPMITPKSGMNPVAAQPKKKPFRPGVGMFGMGLKPFGKLGQFKPKAMQPNKPPLGNMPPVPGAGTPPTPPSSAQTLYEFFKGDLERQKNSALAGARTDASARGVFYGTPLTTSQGDIETEYQRGLGQLQAGILQDEQQNELQRLALATQLFGNGQGTKPAGMDPEVWKQIGALFAPRGGPTAPAMTPGPQAPTTTYRK